MGSNIGGLIGGNNNGWRGSYRGSIIGTLVGTLAGAAIGSAVSAQRQEDLPADAYTPDVRPSQSLSPDYGATQPALPALHIRNIRFIDDNRNHRLDAQESSKVVFEVMNEGDTPLYNVIPIVETARKMKNLRISPSVMLEQIQPGQGIRYTATLTTGRKWRADEVTIRVAVALSHGKNNMICDSHEFTLQGAE